jgi:hypothetical protein
MLDELCGRYLVIAPRSSQGGQRRLSSLWALKALGLQVKELLLDGFKLAVLSLAHPVFSPLRRGLRADHEPALGHTIMAQLKAVITRGVVDPLPGVFSQRLADDLGDEFEGAGNPRDKAELGQVLGMVFAVELAIGHQVARRG